MRTLVYVHGTNGSGKSTLARAVMAAAGGFNGYGMFANEGGRTSTKRGVHLIGRYGNACGGVDGIQPYALVYPTMYGCTRTANARVFAEGLVTPGVQTCQNFASMFDQAVFIHLNTPLDQCYKHVLRRRAAKGNIKPYDATNLYKKAQSAASWANRLEASGLEVHRLNYRQAYELTLALLGLEPPTVEELLA
jgi:hypothetical protein